MSYGIRPGESGTMVLDPPLKVTVNHKPRVWTHLLHTCGLYWFDNIDEQKANPCLACGYRDCPAHQPHHYNPRGCPTCGVVGI